MLSTNKDPITKAIENNPCTLCRAVGLPICKGHHKGGGGGGGGSSSESGEAKSKDTVSMMPMTATLDPITVAAIQEFENAKTIWMQSQLFSENVIHYEAGLFFIESDKLRGNLIFRPKPDLLKDELEIAQEYLKAVKAEFDEFKNQLIDQGISVRGFTAGFNAVDNGLTIQIPNPEFYVAFIKHLERINLLPIPNPESPEKKEVAQIGKEEKQGFNPTPFSTKLERK